MSWGVAIAAVALLAGFGKFFDDYHNSRVEKLKSVAQLYLIGIFVSLDRVAIPDVSIAVCRFIFATQHRITPRRVGIIAVTYFLTTFALYVTIFTAFSNPRILHLWTAIFFTLMATSIFMIFSLPVGRVMTRWLLHQKQLAQRLLTPLVVFLLTIFVAIIFINVIGLILSVSTGNFRLYLPELAGFENDTFPKRLGMSLIGYIAMGAVVEPTSLILVVTAALSLTLALAFVTRLILLAMFDRASDPKKSPFAYFLAFIGVVVLFAKLVQETVK